MARRTRYLATLLMAAGLDPDRMLLFVQSHVRAHAELTWILNCVATFGELSRMVQFKDKSKGNESVSAGLFDYPVLQAADVLLYDTDEVPVGDDQRQHLELVRDIAIRFNHRFGETFVVPRATFPAVGARVMDLQQPTRKMSKSEDSPAGTVLLLDDPKDIAKKIKRAVTDTEAEVRYDPATKPGVSNLLSILAACTGRTPEGAAEGYTQYGPLKNDTADAVVELLGPVQARYAELAADPAEVHRILDAGAERARKTASVTLARARAAVGLLPAG
jgi:tryptophanyl-tRNA synthetase